MRVTNWKRKAVMAAVVGGTASLCSSGETAADVLIHNDGFTGNNLDLPGGQTYGSNAAADDANWSVSVGPWGGLGAPDIALFWDGEGGGDSGYGFDTYTNWNGRGNVVQIDGSASGGTPNHFITFTPTANYAVSLLSFDLDAWAGGGDMDVDWAILDSSNNILTGGNWTKDNTGGRDTISPNFTGALGQELTLRFIRNSGASSYLAMDNLTFAQAVPEPTSAAILVGGLGALALRRRRN